MAGHSRVVKSFIYLFVSMSGFTVQSAIVYGLNLFTMSGSQHVINVIEYKIVESSCCRQLLLTAYHHD